MLLNCVLQSRTFLKRCTCLSAVQGLAKEILWEPAKVMIPLPSSGIRSRKTLEARTREYDREEYDDGKWRDNE